jgi:hypothetical protein
MTFIQPVMLFGLPAVLLPVLIHLLNRLRFRSQKWAAVMFLLSATRSSIRHAKLRHYLVLLFRTLAVLFLILALSRPVIGGWLGMTLAGSPDTVIVLLDRSASMEATDPRTLVSKRSRALALFAQATRQTGHSSRFVLIENALRAPQEIADLSALNGLSIASATDTAADLPATFGAALDYIMRTKPGQTEIWVASDLQKSNWRPETREWQTLNAQLASLPQNIRVRILPLSDAYGHNVAVSLHSAQRRGLAAAQRVDLALDLHRVSTRQETFPLIVTLDGSRSQTEVTMSTPELRVNKKLDIAPDRKSGGWGKVEIPADENSRDNVCYFAYGKDAPLLSAVVADSPAAGKRLRLAAAPASGKSNQSCESVPPDQAAGIKWQELSLVIWQAPAPEGQIAEAIQKFLQSGGVITFFPPGKQDSPAPFGTTWGRIETNPKESPFRIAAWDENDGPLANADSGMNLPLAKLAIMRRQMIVSTNASMSEWHTAASFVDGKPFLLSRRIGKGQAFICASLPTDDWSSLGDGKVLVPVIQRMLTMGGERQSDTINAACGEWRPADEQQAWTSVDGSAGKDYRWQSGVYECGTQRIALNVPPAENDTECLDKNEIRKLLPDVRMQVLDEFSKGSKEATESELWPLFICLALLSMMIESVLLLSDRAPNVKDRED